MNRQDEVFRQESGFTLIEILVSTVIVSIVVITAISVYLTAYRGYDRGNVINLIQGEGSRITNVLMRTIHASVKAEVIDDILILEVDTDSLEYNENGMCRKVTFKHQAPTETDNGAIVQVFEDCADASVLGGTYTNILSNQGAATAVNVTAFTVNVSSDIAQRTYLVGIEFVLGRGNGGNDRSNYNVEVPFNTKISTRGYVN